MSRVAMLGIVALLISGCCSEALCVGWAELGEDYEVELVATSELGAGWQSSCPDDFDLELGDRFVLQDVQRGGNANDGHYCANDCYHLESTPVIDGVEFLSGEGGVNFGRASEMVANGRIRLGESCLGFYALFVQRSGAESSFVVRRSFEPIEGECPSSCTDAWSATIRDDDGTVLQSDAE